MNISGLNEIGNAANSTANGANTATTTTVSTTSAATSSATTLSTAAISSNPSIYMEFGKALAESAISTVSSTAVQSAVNGDSFSKAIKNQGLNILIGAVGNIGAKQIGMNYKTSTQTGMDKAIQLTSHAVLGCAMSAAGGGDCASGAVSGVTGELAGEYLKNNLYSNQPTSSLTNQQKTNIKELAGLVGGYSAIFTGNAIGLSDSEVADNIFSGQRIGKNAAENNYLMPQEKKDLVEALEKCSGDQSCQNQAQQKYEIISKSRDVELQKVELSCIGYGIDCDIVDNFYNGQRMELTKEGNDLYKSLTPSERSDQFVLLPQEKAIYHTYQRDPNTKEVVNVVTGAEQGYKKYVHKTMGYEVVVDVNDNIVTDHLNIGTYNYYNPRIKGVSPNPLINGNKNHFFYDVLPYYLDGNSAHDPTNLIQRIARYGNTYFIDKQDKK